MSLQGRHIVITAGATRAYLDDLRFLSNPATGRLGCEVAGQAVQRGARVTLVRGVDSLTPIQAGLKPSVAKSIRLKTIETIEDLSRALQTTLQRQRVDAVVHSMGVQDFVPVKRVKGKRPSRRAPWIVRLVRAPKVIDRIKGWNPRAVLVGFKLLSEAKPSVLFREARRVQDHSRADAMVANAWGSVKAGRHQAYLVSKDRTIRAQGKTRVARMIVSYLERTLKPGGRR